ncbi:HAD family phosphatase [Kineosporia sp. R_H_3]|uniref:HAD family hydrolase n=1 Tax=Kineosporia sp. R_H_3 TaxID=1961848 RepID=UPI000B4B3DAB|nr:HAD family phosphatase [Kineosporia sp. R_H_3]
MHLVFDLGGVLLRWRPLELVRRALPHRADDAERLARSIFGHPGGEWSRFDRGLLDADGVVAGIAVRTDLTPDDLRAVLAQVPSELVPVPSSVALLERLHDGGTPMFYLSNMPAPHADRLEAEHAFFGLFADGVFSGRVHLAKPDPAIFEVAQERFGVPAGDLLFLDDHAPNVDAARSAGWHALLFTDAAACEAELAVRGLL